MIYMNVAVARKSDEFFKAGEEYKIFSFGAGYVEIISRNNKQVRVDMDDQDFVLIFNKNDGDKVDVVKVD